MAATSQGLVAPQWISIGRACQMLGVNASTLRQWTAAGKLRAYRTPGGHRRFSAAELAALSQSGDKSRPSNVAETVISELRSRYRLLAQSPQTHQGWLAAIDEITRRRFHDLGDELLARLGNYLVTPGQRRRALARAHEIGAEYGRLAHEAGVETTQMVEAYLLFRRPLLDVLARTLSAYPGIGGELGRIMRDAERFMDEVLVGVTEYERAETLP